MRVASIAVRSVNNACRYCTAAKPVAKTSVSGHRVETKMTAWQIHSYGGVEELQLSKSVREPKIQNPNDILIEVNASSVNPIDVAMLNGYGSVLLNGMRQAETYSVSPIIEFPLSLGRDFSGRVIGKGHNVDNKICIGDDVWGVIPPHKQGSHAQRVIVDKSMVHRKPCNLSHLEAASLPYVAVTAWSALKITGDLWLTSAKGKDVLVLGGSGGVGTLAIQLLKAWGSQVVATCRTDAVPLLESLGADCVIDYTRPEYEKLIKDQGKYDIILDAAGIGSECGPEYAKYLKDFRFSKYITLRSPLLRNVDQYGFVCGMLKNAVDLMVPNIKTTSVSASSSVRWAFFIPTTGALEEISTLVERGKICPSIEEVYPFTQLPAAYERVKNGHLRGKIVVDMNSTDVCKKNKNTSPSKTVKSPL